MAWQANQRVSTITRFHFALANQETTGTFSLSKYPYSSLFREIHAVAIAVDVSFMLLMRRVWREIVLVEPLEGRNCRSAYCCVTDGYVLFGGGKQHSPTAIE